MRTRARWTAAVLLGAVIGGAGALVGFPYWLVLAAAVLVGVVFGVVLA